MVDQTNTVCREKIRLWKLAFLLRLLNNLWRQFPKRCLSNGKITGIRTALREQFWRIKGLWTYNLKTSVSQDFILSLRLLDPLWERAEAFPSYTRTQNSKWHKEQIPWPCITTHSAQGRGVWTHSKKVQCGDRVQKHGACMGFLGNPLPAGGPR